MPAALGFVPYNQNLTALNTRQDSKFDLRSFHIAKENSSVKAEGCPYQIRAEALELFLASAPKTVDSGEERTLSGALTFTGPLLLVVLGAQIICFG